MLLPTKVQLILETWRYIDFVQCDGVNGKVALD